MALPRSFVSVLLAASVTACSDSSGSGTSVPTGVDNAPQGYVVGKMGNAFAGISRTLLLVPVVLLPSTRAAAGVSFELDTSVGTPPNTYDYEIPVDSDGDGTQDATIAGRVTFSADPENVVNLIAGFEATVDVTVDTPGGTFTGALELGFAADGHLLVSGTATYDDDITGAIVELAADPAQPLQVGVASQTPADRANACSWNVVGDVEIAVTTLDGEYTALWHFVSGSSVIGVTEATLTPPGGPPEARPDSQFLAEPCPGDESFDDWAGTFLFDWFCVPFDDGDSTFTITLIDSDTIEIADDALIYRAERDPHNPHVVQGTFQDTDGGGTYEEHFVWMMAADGQSFRQVSEYFYLSGPATGSRGFCSGIATRN